MNLEHLAQNLLQAGVHSVGLLTHNFTRPALEMASLAIFTCLPTHSLIHSFICHAFAGSLTICRLSLGFASLSWKVSADGKTDGASGKTEKTHPCSVITRLPGGGASRDLWTRKGEGVHRETCRRYKGTGIHKCLCLQEVSQQGPKPQLPGHKFGLCLMGSNQGTLDGL